jgi:drug/metabolite transporter (DMT)-like permease
LVAFTAFEIAIPWVALGNAERSLPSSTTGLLIAAVPIVGVTLAFLGGRAEHLGPTAWVGLVLGVAGVAALVGFDVGGSDLAAVAQLGITVLGYAIGPAILARHLGSLPGVGVMSLALSITAIVYLPIVLLGDGVPDGMASADVIWSVLLLSTVCTAAAFLMLFALVGEIGPVRATTITYVNPAVAVLSGAVILDEPITIWTILGFALVVAGSYLVNRRPRAPRQAPSPAVLEGEPACR